MGGRGGPLWRRVTYQLPAPVEARPKDETPAPGEVSVEDSSGAIQTIRTQFWPYLEAELTRLQCRVTPEAASGLPFNFWGGFVGYLGYELRAECGSPHARVSGLPDASLFLADRSALPSLTSMLSPPSLAGFLLCYFVYWSCLRRCLALQGLRACLICIICKYFCW